MARDGFTPGSGDVAGAATKAMFGSFNQAGVVVNGLGTTNSDITTSANLVVTGNSLVQVTGVMDCQSSVVGTDEVIGELFKDGVAVSGQIQGTNRVIGRNTVAQTWLLSLSAGTYALKLVARKAAATGTVNIQGQTRLTAIVVPVP